MIERKAYVILVLISVAMSLAMLEISTSEITNNNHKFCQIINTSLGDGPAPKKANPKTDPSRARTYRNYILVKNLGHSLGCL